MGEDTPRLEVVFGRGLRRVRDQQGLTQATLARLAGYGNHSNIAKIERGLTLPSVEKALALARVLRVPIEAFVAEGAVQYTYADAGAVGGFSATYREALTASAECRARLIRVFRSMANDLEGLAPAI